MRRAGTSVTVGAEGAARMVRAGPSKGSRSKRLRGESGGPPVWGSHKGAGESSPTQGGPRGGCDATEAALPRPDAPRSPSSGAGSSGAGPARGRKLGGGDAALAAAETTAVKGRAQHRGMHSRYGGEISFSPPVPLLPPYHWPRAPTWCWPCPNALGGAAVRPPRRACAVVATLLPSLPSLGPAGSSWPGAHAWRVAGARMRSWSP